MNLNSVWQSILAFLRRAFADRDPIPSPVDSGGESSSSPVPQPENPVSPSPPPDAGGGVGAYPFGVDHPDPNDRGSEVGNYDHSSLWKPKSDSDGNLVILTGCQYTFYELTIGRHHVRSCGRNNGHRMHFRFPRPGAWYGPGVEVVGTQGDGSRMVALVRNGARRQKMVWKEAK